MDKRRTCRFVDCSPMQAHRALPLQLLLRAQGAEPVQPDADEACRRNLHRLSLLRVSENYTRPSERRSRRESQEGSGSHEGTWTRRAATRSKYLEEPARTPQVPISPARTRDHQTSAGMEFGHHIHQASSRLCVSCSGHGLVQSACPLTSAVKQPGKRFLRGSLRGGHRKLRSTGNFQHRPRSTVLFSGICGCCTAERDPIQHGWSGESSRQRICRTSMENCEI